MRESILRHKWQQLGQLMGRCRSGREALRAGFTFLELLLVTVIIGTLATMVAPSLERARERAQVAATIANIRIMEAELAIYIEINFGPPASLAEIGRASLLDPWGNPYEYNALTGKNGKSGSAGKARKDKFLVPLNNDYDLYSMGADGESKAPLSPKVSHDDVIRALDGAYVGLASEF